MGVECLSREELDAQGGGWDGGAPLVGWTQRPDTEVILQLLRWRNPKVIVEVGTCLGHITANLCHFSSEEAQVFTIDICAEMGIPIPDNQRVSEELRRRAEVGRYVNHFGDGRKARQILCDSRAFDWTTIPAPDFVFIDGNHTYDYVRHDTEEAFRHLNQGGVIVWHDYGGVEAGVTQAVDEFSETVQGVRRVKDTWVAFWIKRVD